MNHSPKAISAALHLPRRSLLQGAAALGLLGLAGCASTAIPARAKVVVIGGGYGGATAAKYVRLLSDYKIDVVLIEPQDAFISCPMSNLVLGGVKQLADITTPYTALGQRHGITVVKDMASSIDKVKKTVTLAGGATIGYDKLVISPGVELMFDSVEGLKAAQASGQSTRVQLGRSIPVRLLYWTAFLDGEGRISFRKDVYGRDDKLAKALGLGSMDQLIEAKGPATGDVGP